MVNRVLPSTCRECSVGCGSLIHMEDDKVVKITGNPAHPHSQGAFCVKGQNAPIATLTHADRPLHPMRRRGERGDGKWERVSWNEALTEIAQRLGEVKRQHGARSIAGAVSNQFYDRGVVMALLLRSLGSPNYMINQDLCTGCRATAAVLTGCGAQPGNELRKARCVFIVGRSPSESNVVEWMDIKAAKRNGMKLIVADPRRTQIAQMADIWLPMNPGTDAALALSMIHVLFEEDLYDKKFVEQWCAGADDLRIRASMYEPAIAAGITGIPAAQIVETARLWAREVPGSMVLGHGIDAQANGVYTAMAFQALLALSGNVDREGSNRLSKSLKGFKDYVDIVNDPLFRMPADRESQIIGGENYPFWSGPGSWGKACHNPSVIEAMISNDPYPVRAAYISGVNIVCTYPGMQKTIAALKGLDLLIVATDHMTPTAELADFLLPKTSLLEEEAVFANEGPCLSIMRRVVEPLGETRTDVEIAIGLRDKLHEYSLLDFPLLPWNSHREMIDYQLENTGIDFDTLCETGFLAYPFSYEQYRTNGFKTPSGKIELASHKLEDAGYDPLPDYRESSYVRSQAGFDLILMTGIRTMAYHHSRFHNHGWARKIQNAPELKIHPDAAERLGIVSGDWASVETPGGGGRVYLQAKVTEEVPANVVATGMGWWYPEMSGADRGALNFNVEAAIPYGPHWDPISGSAEARNCACRVRRAEVTELPKWPSNGDPRLAASQR